MEKYVAVMKSKSNDSFNNVEDLKGRITTNGKIVATILTVKGDKGDKGEPFKYDDFTPEQLSSLKGEKRRCWRARS